MPRRDYISAGAQGNGHKCFVLLAKMYTGSVCRAEVTVSRGSLIYNVFYRSVMRWAEIVFSIPTRIHTCRMGGAARDFKTHSANGQNVSLTFYLAPRHDVSPIPGPQEHLEEPQHKTTFRAPGGCPCLRSKAGTLEQCTGLS